MATTKKLLQAAAGSAGGAGLNVEEVFNSNVYEGTGSGRTFTNGLDLSGEGGLVWIKNYSNSDPHMLVDTVRGASNGSSARTLQTNSDSSAFVYNDITAFNSDGFTTGGTDQVSRSSNRFASWAFRKAPKFFDIQTWSGTSSTRTISHNLGCTPGMIIIKSYDSSSTNWMVWHRGLSNTSTKFLYLNASDAEQSYGTTSIAWGNTAPTSTEFTVGSATYNNETGKNYIAYIFAHNDGDGGFGENGDQDIIKCGSYVGSGAAGKFIDLGFEPQWVYTKKITNSSVHIIQDYLRGLDGTTYNWLYANEFGGAAGGSLAGGTAFPTGDGYIINGSYSDVNGSGETYVYMAIRRGPMATPTNVDDVFDIDVNTSTEPEFTSGFPVDFALHTNVGSNTENYLANRLTAGKYMFTEGTAAESLAHTNFKWDYPDGWLKSFWAGNSNVYSYMWRRAPGFCDVVCYEGDANTTQAITHNLGVKPEFAIGVDRSGSNWIAATKITDTTYHEGYLNTSGSLFSQTLSNTTSEYGGFTDTTVSVRQSLNGNGADHILYLFASLDGISKVGTFSTSSDLVVDCGFTNGVQFLLLKRVPTGNANWDSWFIFDKDRGITTGADNTWELDTATIQFTDGNNIEQDASGFKVKSGPNLNFANGQEIFYYAIASE